MAYHTIFMATGVPARSIGYNCLPTPWDMNREHHRKTAKRIREKDSQYIKQSDREAQKANKLQHESNRTSVHGLTRRRGREDSPSSYAGDSVGSVAVSQVEFPEEDFSFFGQYKWAPKGL